ncbi:hypothetical protein ACFPC0_27815 [Streptomyces andamanensis]|uniref:Uncharacterized protein n=1 Tax=Streptomyces andamanensis TaxID=1565035 RepID=A0ABV8TLX3_9ACTN
MSKRKREGSGVRRGEKGKWVGGERRIVREGRGKNKVANGERETKKVKKKRWAVRGRKRE